jgi:radical SAM protein with 4Fe4S-binding SPASM domain
MQPKRYVLRPEFFGGILFDKERKDYFYVDAQTTTALQKVAQDYGKIVFPKSYLDFLKNEGVIDLTREEEALFLGDVVNLEQRPEDFPASPLRIHLAITYKCPLDCAHCFVRNYRSRQMEMNAVDFKKLIDRLVEMGTYEILVSGGEPFIRKDLCECLDYALVKGMIVKLFTNGLLLGEDQIRKLQGLKLNYLAIGFDGPNPISYSSIRREKGRAVFDKVVRNIQRARKLLNIPVAIQFTCTKRNTDHETLSQIVEFSVENDVLLRVRPVNPCGNTLANPDLLLDYQEYLSILQSLYELFLGKGCSPEDMKAKQGNIRFKFSRRSIKFDESPLPYLGWGCPGGYVHAFIDPYGNMYPCGFLVSHLPRDENDNVKIKDPLDIWLNGKGFLFKRSLSGNDTCFECNYFVTCRGGCRIRALHWKKDINAPDQYCRQELKAYKRTKGLFLEGNDCV